VSNPLGACYSQSRTAIPQRIRPISWLILPAFAAQTGPCRISYTQYTAMLVEEILELEPKQSKRIAEKLLLSAVTAAGGYFAFKFLFEPWQQTWGAYPHERDMWIPGDERVPEPDGVTTRAVTVNAPPEYVYPWLIQMGKGRGGLYSYDWLDILFKFIDEPSAEHILKEFQHLEVGDKIPLGAGEPFPVVELEENRLFVLGGESEGVKWTWQTALIPFGEDRTRLITRNRIDFPGGSGAKMIGPWLEVAAFIMVRKWLLNLKDRGERLYAEDMAGA